jgi:hypothetical protein
MNFSQQSSLHVSASDLVSLRAQGKSLLGAGASAASLPWANKSPDLNMQEFGSTFPLTPVMIM